MLRLFCVIVAIFLPPVAVFIIKGASQASLFALVSFCAGIGMFFMLFALPGLVVWMLSIVYALGVSMFAKRVEP
jgi:uncharacterized membrane protein YqaE (UPF0057 family)